LSDIADVIVKCKLSLCPCVLKVFVIMYMLKSVIGRLFLLETFLDGTAAHASSRTGRINA